MPDIDCTREQLSLYPGSKLGFVMYRLTYSDDEQWSRSLTHLNTRIRTCLVENGYGDIFSFVDWTVQEDPALDEACFDLDDALYEKLRRRYVIYSSQHPEDMNFSVPRSLAFIAATQDHVNWILESPGPEKYSSDEGFLDLVAVDPEDGVQSVSLSLVFPRAYSLIDGLGFKGIRIGPDDIFRQ